MAIPQSWLTVGNKIHALRKTSRLTLKQLARGCGLSANTISLVERGKVAPSIETLCKIATALGVAPGSLFLEACTPRVFLQRAARNTGGSDLGVQVTKAMHGEAVTGEIDEIDLAQVHSEIMQETGSPGRSSILCLCGQIDFDVDGQSYCLEPGDNLTFNSDAYHRLRNTSSTPGTAVLVLRPHVPYIPVSED